MFFLLLVLTSWAGASTVTLLTSETFKTTIEDLKELRELLKPYETKTIEVDLHKVKKKVRSDVK